LWLFDYVPAVEEIGQVCTRILMELSESGLVSRIGAKFKDRVWQITFATFEDCCFDISIQRFLEAFKDAADEAYSKGGRMVREEPLNETWEDFMQGFNDSEIPYRIAHIETYEEAWGLTTWEFKLEPKVGSNLSERQ
jgi:hypothetical protein